MHGTRHELTLRFRMRWLAHAAFAGAVSAAALLGLLRVFLDAPLDAGFSGAWHTIETLRRVLLPAVGFAVLLWVLLSAAAMGFIAHLVAHRIAGPLLRLEHLAEGLRHGDLAPAPNVRRGDQLPGLAAAIGELEHSLAAQLRPAVSGVEEIERSWEELDGVPPAEYATRAPAILGRIEARLAAIEESLDTPAA